MKAEDIVLLLIIVAVGATVWCFVLRLPPCPSPYPEPIVEEASDVGKLDLSPMPKQPTAMPHPLVEYPDAALNYVLVEPASELEEETDKVLSRPLIEYSNSALGIALEEPQTSAATFPRPLVEYSDGAIVFVLEQPTGADLFFAQERLRPLVEYADAGWSGSLSPPSGLLKEGGRE